MLVVVLVGAACGDDTSPALETVATTSTTTTTTSTTTTTTTTTLPSGPVFIREGDRGNEVVALQTLLTCAGYGTLVADGVYGSKTAAAVQAAQAAFSKEQTGEPDEETFALVSRECDRAELLDLGGDGSTLLVGNVADGDDDLFTVGVRTGSVLTVETDHSVTLRVDGEDGGSLESQDGRLVYESPAAQLATIAVSATAPTTYVLSVDLAPPGANAGGEAGGGEGPVDAAEGIGKDWSGDLPGGLVDFDGTVDCVGEESGSDCHAYYGTIVARPGSFTGSGADNPIEAMAWLLRNTGAQVNGHALWEIVDAVVFEAPIGDTVLNECYPRGGGRNLVVHADLTLGSVTGAVQWDWLSQEISIIAPDGIVCVNGAGDHIAVGPGFG
ncbi:MAG: peptidoglycan-binding protein [Acidimicrobiia bacterium]|nr:peptidoglycan-binding protein [Acidimicrobiia bacterium]